MGYLTVDSMSTTPKEDRIYKERIELEMSNKFNKKHRFKIITYEQALLDKFQNKCVKSFGDNLDNSIMPNGDNSIMFTIEFYDEDREKVIKKCKKIAHSLKMYINIDTGTWRNISYYLRPITFPIGLLIYLFYVIIVRPIKEKF